MRVITVLTLAALLSPFAAALPALHEGTQNGARNSETTRVAAQSGTGFVLLGAVGDHDVVFVAKNGATMGASSNCGPDMGTVPPGAAFADITMWTATGLPACASSPVETGGSSWVYVDGLPSEITG